MTEDLNREEMSSVETINNSLESPNQERKLEI